MLDLVKWHHGEGVVRDNVHFAHIKLSERAALETRGSGSLPG